MNKRSFLDGGGEMGQRMRQFDWSATRLGAPSGWSQALRTVVRALLNTGHPMFIFWGADALCFYNDAYARSLGPEKHPSTLGRRGIDVWPEIWEAIGPQIDQVMGGGSATWHENQLLPIWRHGRLEEVYWTYSYSPIDDEDAANGIGGVLVLCSETTGHMLSMRKADEERQRFAELFEQAPGFMAMLDGPQHVFEFVNPGYRSLIGHRDILGKSLAEALPDAAAQGYVALLDRVYCSGEAFSASDAPYAMQLVPGGPVLERFVDFVFQPIKNETGQVRGIFVEGIDITERHLALRRRDALTRLSDEIRTVESPREVTLAAARILGETLQASRAGYGNFVRDGDVIEVESEWHSPGVERLPDVLDLRTFGDFVDDLRLGKLVVVDDAATDPRTAHAAPALRQFSAASFVHLAVFDRGRLLAVIFINHAGPRQWTEEDLALVREVGARIGTATERLRAEIALRESEAKLREANETLEAKVGARTHELMGAEEALRHSQKMEAVGQLTGGLAHDFNNLLAGIMGSLDMLRLRLGQGRVADLDRYVDMAQRSGKRAAALTHRLLAFSRRQTLAPKATDVNQLIGGMEELIRRTVEPTIALQVVADSALWPTLIDPPQLENALLNLCINARDAMPEGGQLTVETANRVFDDGAAAARELAPGEYVSICVTDTGTGMAPQVAARVFDPFYTTKPMGEGTGLGLSMVYGFARQSGGRIRIYTEVGLGTTMCIYLPRHHGTPDAVAEPVGEAAATDARQAVVLVIDDEETVRTLVAEVLAERGCVVLQAADGPSGLHLLESLDRIDLLITDVGLPGGLNGRQVADMVRLTRPELPILFITGYAEHAVMGSGKLAPGMQVITKPFALQTFAARVNEMIDSGAL